MCLVDTVMKSGCAYYKKEVVRRKPDPPLCLLRPCVAMQYACIVFLIGCTSSSNLSSESSVNSQVLDYLHNKVAMPQYTAPGQLSRPAECKGINACMYLGLKYRY